MSQGTFKRRIVVVTGGASGIGRATAEAFVAAGATVGVLDRMGDDGPTECTLLQADVTQDAEVARAIGDFAAQHGRIDVLVNNAGITYPATVEQGPLDDWKHVLDVNVLGFVRTTRAALPWLRKADGASIVNMGSCTVGTGLRRRVLYSATKGAIEAMTRAMAADLVHEGIRVNCVSPGTVDTPLIQKQIADAPDPAHQRQVFNDRQPTGFMLKPYEVANAVLYLANPAARSTVGSVLSVDGGIGTLRLFDS